MPSYRYIPEFMQARSQASRSAWEKRWEEAFFNGEKLGPKGQKYIDQKFGPEIGGGEPLDEDWPDVWDFDYDDGDRYLED